MSWIGGDLAGLQAMGTAMKTAPDSTKGIVQALSSKTDTVVSDVGWTGGGAAEFRKAWTATSIQVGGIATATSNIGNVLADLGDNLQKMEADLVNVADEARRKGAQIGDDGTPKTLVISGDPDTAAARDARQAQTEYANLHDSVLLLARRLRLQAAKDINDIIAQLKPTGHDSDFSWDKRVTVADYLRALYVVPNEKNSLWAGKLQGAIDEADTTFHESVQAYVKAHDAVLAEGGDVLPADDPAALAYSKARNDLGLLQDKLKTVEADKGGAPLSNLLNVKIKDAAKVVPGLDKIETPKSLDFLKDIPVVDVLATAAVSELQTQDDIDRGQNPTSARLYDYGAGAIGLAAGAAAAAALPEAAPVAAVAVIAGGVVVGVGDTFYEGFHEHWAEDIHDRGVVNGILYGNAHTLSSAKDDVVDLGDSAWNATKKATTSLWHKAFG